MRGMAEEYDDEELQSSEALEKMRGIQNVDFYQEELEEMHSVLLVTELHPLRIQEIIEEINQNMPSGEIRIERQEDDFNFCIVLVTKLTQGDDEDYDDDYDDPNMEVQIMY